MNFVVLSALRMAGVPPRDDRRGSDAAAAGARPLGRPPHPGRLPPRPADPRRRRPALRH